MCPEKVTSMPLLRDFSLEVFMSRVLLPKRIYIAYTHIITYPSGFFIALGVHM